MGHGEEDHQGIRYHLHNHHHGGIQAQPQTTRSYEQRTAGKLKDVDHVI